VNLANLAIFRFQTFGELYLRSLWL